MRSVPDAPFEQGWSSVKLYFMIGLPTETDEDVLGIADLAQKVRTCYFAVPKEQRAPGAAHHGQRVRVRAEELHALPVVRRSWTSETVVRRQQLLKERAAPTSRA